MSTFQTDAIEIKLVYRPATEFDDEGNAFSLAAHWELLILDGWWQNVVSQDAYRTVVVNDLPEFGYAKAWVVPTDRYNNRTTVNIDYLEYGWAKATQLPLEYVSGARMPWLFWQCKLCAWATGEVCLPCTVNPLGYGKEECCDFERLGS